MTQEQKDAQARQISEQNLRAIQGTKSQALQTVLSLVQSGGMEKSEKGMSVDDFLKEAKKIEQYIWSEPNRIVSKVIS